MVSSILTRIYDRKFLKVEQNVLKNDAVIVAARIHPKGRYDIEVTCNANV